MSKKDYIQEMLDLSNENVDRKLYEECFKYGLMTTITSSKFLKESISKNERINMLEWVKNMTYSETIATIFNEGHKLNESDLKKHEAKWKTFLKYSLAMLAGGALVASVHQGSLSVASTSYRKATDSMFQAFNYSFTSKKELGDHYANQAAKYAKIGDKSLNVAKNIEDNAPAYFISAALLSALTYFLYRRMTDPCRKQCGNRIFSTTKEKVCMYTCEIKSIENMINKIKKDMGQCSSTPYPTICRNKLEKELKRWNEKLKDAKEKLVKAKSKLNK